MDKPTECGAKLSVRLTRDDVARVVHSRWDASHECGDFESQVEGYRECHGRYPEVVLGDTIYGSRDSRRFLKELGVRFAGWQLGRPKRVTDKNRLEVKRLKVQRRDEYLQRILMEGKFCQGKNGYRLNSIRAMRSDTSRAWINCIFLVMNLLTLLRVFNWLWSKDHYLAPSCNRCVNEAIAGLYPARVSPSGTVAEPDFRTLAAL